MPQSSSTDEPFIFAASEEEESNIKIKDFTKGAYFSNTGKYIIETIKTPTINKKVNVALVVMTIRIKTKQERKSK